MDLAKIDDAVSEIQRLKVRVGELAETIALLTEERDELRDTIRKMKDADSLYMETVESGRRRAMEILGAGNFDNIDHAAQKAIDRIHRLEEENERRGELAEDIVVLREELDDLLDVCRKLRVNRVAIMGKYAPDLAVSRFAEAWGELEAILAKHPETQREGESAQRKQ